MKIGKAMAVRTAGSGIFWPNWMMRKTAIPAIRNCTSSFMREETPATVCLVTFS